MNTTWKYSIWVKLITISLAILFLFATGISFAGVLYCSWMDFYAPGAMPQGQFVESNAYIQNQLKSIQQYAATQRELSTPEEAEQPSLLHYLEDFEATVRPDCTNLRFACYDASDRCFWTNDLDLTQEAAGMPTWSNYALDWKTTPYALTFGISSYQVEKHFDTFLAIKQCHIDALVNRPEDYQNWFFTNDLVAQANRDGFDIECSHLSQETTMTFSSIEDAKAYPFEQQFANTEYTVSFSPANPDNKADLSVNATVRQYHKNTDHVENLAAYYTNPDYDESWTITDKALAEALTNGFDITINATTGTTENVSIVLYLPKILRVDDTIRADYDIFSTVYQWRYSFIICTFGFALLSIWACVMMCQVAGHRRDSDEIVGSWFHHRPYELFCLLPLVCLFFVAETLLSSDIFPTVPTQILLTCLILCTAASSTLWLYTTAVRVKTRSFLRSFLGVRILLVCHKLCNTQWRACALATLFLAFYFFLNVFALPEVRTMGIILILELDLFALICLFYCIYCIATLYRTVRKMVDGDFSVPQYPIPLWGVFGDFARALNCMTSGITQIVAEQTKAERMRSELITNVSHDLKTPLTSIVSYVGLLKREPMATEAATAYLEVLERQSNRLKKLTEDLVEASKASTGNLTVDLQPTDVGVLIEQLAGEYEEKLATRHLSLKVSLPEQPVQILADGKLLYRVFDNLLGNAYKYSMPGTRIYLDGALDNQMVRFSIKNVSEQPLNVKPEDLTERFVRGDASRSTEGSGLGLSIAKDLTALQHGNLRLEIDGDLFKALVLFPVLQTSFLGITTNTPPEPPATEQDFTA